MFHRIGEHVSPMRMPIIDLNTSEVSELWRTTYSILSYIIRIQSKIMPPAPRLRSFNQSVDWSVDGKALLISANITYSVFPSALALSMAHRKIKALLLVRYPVLNPFCDGGRILYFSHHDVSRMCNTLLKREKNLCSAVKQNDIFSVLMSSSPIFNF